MHILLSLVAGVLSAAIGWLTAALVGSLLGHLRGFEGLGPGLLMAGLLYLLALVFGVVGFVCCLVFLSRRGTAIPK
jgi:hypothetical protein